jgi:hypothetical protein
LPCRGPAEQQTFTRSTKPAALSKVRSTEESWNERKD